MKAKKMKLEIRKVSNDACRKDLEAEEKWLEHCGEDEEFLKRESKRLHRDILRIAPVYIGGPGSEGEKLFQGWESVAGLQDVIRCLKEVVILPLLYPEFFNNLGLTPPRGVLLHGYPGTGKTLVVRALIGSCARGDKRIAYFARKGADCLGKYVGDAERQLRLLFQVAERSQPSIIFFDEIDGLAPCRTRQQDQTHSSVVSTLLALLDGFAGADLQALCTQAAIIALKRNCPFQELVSHAGEKAPDRNRYPLPSFAVEERDWLEALSCAPPPCSRREAGMSANEVVSSPLPTHLISCLLRPLSSLLVSLYLDECLYLPPLLYKAAKMIKNVIVGALRKKKMPNDHWWAQVNDLLQKADVIKEIERNLSCLGILIGEAGFPFSDALNDDTDEDRVRFDPSRAYHNGIHTTLLRKYFVYIRKEIRISHIDCWESPGQARGILLLVFSTVLLGMLKFKRLIWLQFHRKDAEMY
ncbi:putative AAA domain-containing protein P22H7.05c [Vitis vinifera]|uniref:Putative AAA domain-containing protein P22H7.05c n=1 Tax=Vitis vinifera TaxID=29760 RepID=A0A438BSW9_VITVI|nr:putative AAA domain-containing protein P22H7.05c [Vitis vinifera]